MAGRFKRFISQAADALFIPGNAYNSNTDHWNPATTKVGIAGMLADQFIPGGSNIVGMAANSGLLGSGISSGLQRENTYNGIADQFGETRQGLADYLHSQQVDVGGNPQVSVGGPQTVSLGSYAPSIPTMPNVQAQAPWSPLGTSTGNVFNGGSLGNWANGGGAPSGMHYGNGAGAGTGYGGASYANDKFGDMAAGFGLGAQGAGASSSGAYALADAMTQNKRNRK